MPSHTLFMHLILPDDCSHIRNICESKQGKKSGSTERVVCMEKSLLLSEKGAWKIIPLAEFFLFSVLPMSSLARSLL